VSLSAGGKVTSVDLEGIEIQIVRTALIDTVPQVIKHAPSSDGRFEA